MFIVGNGNCRGAPSAGRGVAMSAIALTRGSLRSQGRRVEGVREPAICSNSIVVPANAGTDNHRCSLLESRRAAALKLRSRGVWVPAFAGTTGSPARGAVGGAEVDVFEQGGGDGGDLLAVRRSRDRDAGLVEDGLDAGALRVQVIEQLCHQHAVAALAVVGDFSWGRGGQDQRVVGRCDRRQAVGEGTETALIGVAAGGGGVGQVFPRPLVPPHPRAGIDRDAPAAGNAL